MEETQPPFMDLENFINSPLLFLLLQHPTIRHGRVRTWLDLWTHPHYETLGDSRTKLAMVQPNSRHERKKNISNNA